MEDRLQEQNNAAAERVSASDQDVEELKAMIKNLQNETKKLQEELIKKEEPPEGPKADYKEFFNEYISKGSK